MIDIWIYLKTCLISNNVDHLYMWSSSKYCVKLLSTKNYCPKQPGLQEAAAPGQASYC